MTAVTGVRSHQTMLDVTGNNIANVNTTGFKKDMTIFQDLLYQTSQGASGPGDARGGTNPAQVGLGVKLGAIETIHSQGPAQYTGNKSDMMISGEGYFVLRDGSSRIYSRAGNFVLDADSDLVHSGTGYNVQGYKMVRDTVDPTKFITAGDISDIRIPMQSKLEARATELVGFKCNLDSRLDVGEKYQTKQTIYDCQGFAYTLEVEFEKTPTDNTWKWEAYFVDEEGNRRTDIVLTSNTGNIEFDASCHLKTPETVTIGVPYSSLGRKDEQIILDFSGKSFGLNEDGKAMEGVTQFASDSTTKGYYQNGYPMGILNDYSVGKDGIITGIYTNDQKQPLYRIALAQFANPQGLDKMGDTMFRETVNSGLANINAAMVNGGGRIDASSLEMSNVDLTEEFTRLIIAQRGFQANTRVVTTSDQILEEVVNLKR
jgi:flagellar hook protein FlgE